jgi:FixJ family two-component response regulator
MESQTTVFVVDDDANVRSALKSLLVQAGYHTETFASAEEFLASVPATRGGCLIADFRMPGMDGLEFQQSLRERGYLAPIILLTAYADVRMAVTATKAGALDVLEKPVIPQRLLERVRDATDRDAATRQLHGEAADIQRRLSQLTPREHEILSLIVAGKPTKVIAATLGTSRNTVDNQRTRILRKMQADSAVDLVRMVMTAKALQDTSSIEHDSAPPG